MNDTNAGAPQAPGAGRERGDEKTPEPPQRFGTRAQPREINVMIGKGGARIMKPGEVGLPPDGSGGDPGTGTRSSPRNVTSGGGGVAKPQARVVSREPSKQIRMGQTVRPPLPGDAGNVRHLRLPSATVTREGVARADENPTARHEELVTLRATCPSPGERILVMPKGAALSLRTFLRSGTPIGRQFCPAILRVIGDAMARPREHAVNWGFAEVPIELRDEDVRLIAPTTRRIRPVGDVLKRILAAVDRAFLAEKRLTAARELREGPSILDMVDGADDASLPQRASRGDGLPEHDTDTGAAR